MITPAKLPVTPFQAEPPSVADQALSSALEKSEMVQQRIEESADQLLVVNTVLKKEIPEIAHNGNARQALNISTDLEEKLQQSAVELARVNQTLECEIDERQRLEQELQTVKAELANAKGHQQHQPSQEKLPAH